MKTKDRILKSLWEIMYETPFEDITVSEICENAGVNRSTYYRNFNSKEEIIEYKLEAILDEYIENFEKMKNKNQKTYIFTILETFHKYKDFLKIIHKHNQSYILQKTLLNYFKDNLNFKSKEKLYESYYHIGGIYNFIICWLENDMDENIEELSDIGVKITEKINPLYDFKLGNI